jgi:hypothetical protein
MDQAMSEPARNRFALDLEDLERQLRGAAQTPKPGHAADPLAELTRIVGQDDPLKDLFAQRPQGARPQGYSTQGQGAQVVAAPWQQQARQEPSFAPAPVAQVPEAAPPAEIRGALDEFEALLRRNEPVPVQPRQAEADHTAREYHAPEPQAYQRSVPAPSMAPPPRDLDEEAASYAYGYDEPNGAGTAQQPVLADEDMPDLEPRRSYKGLWTAAALLAVGVIGVGAAMSYRSATPSGKGQPLVISADNGPTKVEPVNPGGTEVPNQNKQIYDRPSVSPTAPTKVVSSSEQPVDVQQAARAMVPRVVLPGSASAASNGAEGTTNPLAQAPAAPAPKPTAIEPALTPVPPVPGLGEPRKVRTVSIRPDGTPAGAGINANAAGPAANNSAPLVTGSAPARPIMPSMAMPNAATPGEASRPVAAPPKVQERAAAPATTPAPAPTPPLRIASAPAAAPAAPAPSTAAIRSGTGDFTVQLAAPGSEAEARATFAALVRKYPDQLRGQNPIVRKTDLAGGKTVFRLRVGPYSRDDATTMCSALQSAGGQCFISKN